MHKGVVIKSTGSWYLVRDNNGDIHQSRIIGKFRLNGLKLTNPVAVGDIVHFEIEEEEKAIIKKIEPRRNYVVRQSPRKRHFLHLLAANIDHAIIIMTIVEPMLKQGFIDRFLMMTEPHDIPVTIVFNKCDLYGEAEMSMYEYLKDIYTKIGYNVLLISAGEDINMDALRERLKSKITLVSGQSGVGKSTIVNTLTGEDLLDTYELSESSGKGQHTTTFAEMYPLGDETFIIDTPGMKSLSFNNYEVMDVAHNFKELFAFSENCKYSDCTHRNEPNCAVKEAIEANEISELRYFNYLALLDEVEDQNYWERLKDL